MNPIWFRQVWAVMRLELLKTFLNKRSFWIYLLALAPVLIFGGHAFEVMQRGEDRVRLAERNPGVTLEKMRQVQTEMSRADVIRILGEPAGQSKIGGRRSRSEILRYSDGKAEVHVILRDDEVTRVRIREGCSLAEDTLVFATVFQFFYLRLMVFFGCVFVFINLFRGELLDKSLHYYFLAPIRREVVVAGKYLAGLMATVVIFGSSVALQIAVLNLHFPAAVLDEYLHRGNAWHHAFSYIGVTALACVGYGTVFLAAGILLRNPLIPALVIMLWESINGILPAMLRKVSVIYYLRSLCPVEISIDRNVPPPIAMLALNVEPVAPWVAVLGVTLVSVSLLAFAAWSARRLEINYGTE